MAPRIRILVNTCLRYCDRTIPPLLESLVVVGGVPREAIDVVVGETPLSYAHSPTHSIAHHFVPYANMDNNALIWASQQDDRTDWYFYLHDTCSVTEGFYRKVVTRVAELDRGPTLAAMVHYHSSMCIGLYRQSALSDPAIRNLLEKKINLDTSSAVVLGIKNSEEVEDFVFNCIRQHHGAHTVWVFPNTYTRLDAGDGVYGTGVQRIFELYADPGIIKMKANWGQSNKLHINL